VLLLLLVDEEVLLPISKVVLLLIDEEVLLPISIKERLSVT